MKVLRAMRPFTKSTNFNTKGNKNSAQNLLVIICVHTPVCEVSIEVRQHIPTVYKVIQTGACRESKKVLCLAFCFIPSFRISKAVFTRIDTNLNSRYLRKNFVFSEGPF